jgi:hypothetical protein
VAVVPPPVLAAGAGYHPLAPVRALDSRTATGGWSAPLVAATPMDLTLGGTNGIPPTASAVVLAVTALGGADATYVTAWPTGADQPASSNLNVAPGQNVANLVTVALGTDGKVRFATAAGSTHLLADITGWYDDGTGPGDLYTGVTPVRALDSRTATGGWAGPLVAGTPQDLAITGLPESATAVVGNLTVTGADQPTYVAVGPAGTPPAGTSNLNVGPGGTRAVGVVAKLGTGGRITFVNGAGAAHVIFDVTGAFGPTGARFHALPATRVLDSRAGVGLTGAWAAATSRSLALGGVDVPADATAVVANVVATDVTGPTFVTVYPDAAGRPATSTLNAAEGETVANAVTTGLGRAAC